MKHKSKVGFRLRSQHTSRGKTVVINQRWVVTTHPVDRIRRVRHDGIKRLLITILRIDKRIAQTNIKLVIIDVVQKHIHTCQVIGCMIDFLPKESILNNVVVKLLLCLQEQRTRTTSRVVDFVDRALSQHRKACYEVRHVLRRKEFASRLTRIGCIIRNQKLVCIAKKVNLIVLKLTEV